MLVPYRTDCQLLRALAALMGLPATCTCTALTYLHRVRNTQHPSPNFSSQELVAACIYVAAKVEEVNVSANQLINSARLLSHPQQNHLLQNLAPLLPGFLHQQQEQAHLGCNPAAADEIPAAADHTPAVDHKTAAAAATEDEVGQQELQPSSPAVANSSSKTGIQQQQQQDDADLPSHQPQQQQQQQQQWRQEEVQEAVVIVVGDQYYAAKERLFAAEQVVLRLMSFQLGVDQPHKHLFNFCKLLGASRAATAAAVCVLNDTMAYTSLCLSAEPAGLAAAALQLAVVCLGRQQQRQRQHQQPEHVGTAAAEDVGAAASNGIKHGSLVRRHQQNISSSQEHQAGGGVTAGNWPAVEQADAAAAAATATLRVPSVAQMSQDRPSTGEAAAAAYAAQASSADLASVCSPAAAALLEDGSWMELVGLKPGPVFVLMKQLQQTLQQLS